MAAPGAPGPGSGTVLMAARAELDAPCRLLPAAGTALRLQLSVQAGKDGRRRFRLGLRLAEPLAEFDLRDVSYRVCGPARHRLRLPGTPLGTPLGTPGTPLGTPPAPSGTSLGPLGTPPGPEGTEEEGTAEEEGTEVALRFPEEREAQQWWTVLSSSLREARRAPEGDTGTAPVPPPGDGEEEEEEEEEEEARLLELAQTEELALSLAEAVALGDEALARQSAVALARRRAELSVSLREPGRAGTEISLSVCIEDAACSASATLRVQPHITIGTLKEQVSRELGFPAPAQRWIIGQSLCRDGRSLSSYGVRADGDTAFLFLLSAHQLPHSLLGAVGLGDTPGTPGTGRVPEPPEPLDPGDLGDHLESLQLWDGAGAPPTAPEPRPPSPEQGWSCPRCTFLNKPTRPGCEMCSSPRPQGYRVPGGHRPDPAEQRRLQRERDGARQCQQALEAERQRNFQALLRAEQAELVPNPEPLECGICLQGVPAGRGVLLRDCLHSFCRECLRAVIQHSPEAAVPCPYRDVTYACDSHLQDREIRALLSPDEHAQFLARGLALAERRSRGSFHCRRRDCPGWCFTDTGTDGTDTGTEGSGTGEFLCPVCGARNCLSCQAIHEGQSCRQHREALALRAQQDAAARETREMLEALVQRGEAMRCPTCGIVVQKRDGCDWVQCGVCRTELCWVTKGPRWGPGGPGDTSAGCRCNVNGQRCHPRCQNCH